MKCLVTSFGSAGDFLPTLTTASVLKRRGHEVRFVANPFYESRARNAGLDLTPAGDFDDLYDRFERTPAYGDPRNAGMLFRDLVVPNSVATYRVLSDLLRSESYDVVVAGEACFSAVWAAKERNIPSIITHASPLIWMSWRAPSAIGDRPLPLAVTRPLTVAVRGVMSILLSRWLRVLATQIGTSLRDVSFNGTSAMAAHRLALWSPLLRGSMKGDPANGTICGFTRASAYGGVQQAMPPEVDAFLADGAPPIVVGFGSAFSLISGPLLVSIAAACADLGLRCLVIGHPSGVTFPSNTLAVPYAPYDRVFPRAAAVVVHCGAGTTGEALRSGKAIVAVPFAFDQFALAAAIEQLNIAVRVRVARRSRADFGRVLARVLADDALRDRAAVSGPKFAAERDGAEVGADTVERVVGVHSVIPAKAGTQPSPSRSVGSSVA